MSSVNTIDFVVIIIYFVVLVGIGYLVMKRAKSSEDYLLAGRKLPLPIFICAMSATVLGGGSTVGGAALAYQAGLGGIWLSGMYVVSIFLLAMLLGTKLSKMRILSTSESLGIFYGSYTRSLSAIINVLYLILVAVLQITGMGSIIGILIGVTPETGMIIGGCVILAYILLGGMWAVAMTDILQFIVMTVGIIILVPIFALPAVGGFEGIAEKLPETHFDITDLGLQRIVAYIILIVPGFLSGQDFWQKAFTAKNKKVATRGTMISSLYILIFGCGVILLGMCYYAVNPNLTDTNAVYASAAIEFMPAGFKGLTLAAALAAIMSTANGGILGSSTVFYNDLLKRKINIPKNKEVMINRILCVIATALAVIFSIYVKSVLVALDIAFTYIAGCLFVPLIFAFLLKRVSAKAGFYSIIASLFTVTFFFIKNGITALEPILFGILVSAIVFFVINFADSKRRMIDFTDDGEVIIDGVKEKIEKDEKQ